MNEFIGLQNLILFLSVSAGLVLVASIVAICILSERGGD
jgi:type III secretory pathway component EscS